MSKVENEVRDFLRAADVLFARLQTGKPQSLSYFRVMPSVFTPWFPS